MRWSINSPYFLEHKGSLLCSEGSAIGPGPEPDESSPRSSTSREGSLGFLSVVMESILDTTQERTTEERRTWFHSFATHVYFEGDGF
jgi:hypothetical protein